MGTSPAVAEPRAPEAPKLDYLAIYNAYRDYLKHEDELINRRLSWNLTLQGFLFAVYGVTLQLVYNTTAYKLPPDTHFQRLPFVFPFLGITVAILSRIGVVAAQRAIDSLRDRWKGIADELKTKGEELPVPALTGGGDEIANKFGNKSALIPIVIILAWLLLMILPWWPPELW
jgi:hypothetical protein